MMAKYRSFGWFAIVAALALVGCDRGEEPATAPAATPAAETDGAATVVEVSEDTRVKFNTLIEQLTKHIRNGEFEAAETELRELDSMRAQIDEPMQRQVEMSRASLSAARTGGSAPAAQPANPPPAAQ